MALHVRPIARTDLSGVIDVAASAFMDDELNTFLYPGRHKHPDTYRAIVKDRVKCRFVTAGAWGFVCVDSDNKVLGFAWWLRSVPASWREERSQDQLLQNNQSWATCFEAKLLAIESWYNNSCRAWPVVDHARARQLHALEGEQRSLDPLLKNVRGWYLESLAVIPAAQRRGIGSLLIAWGLEQARHETTRTGVSVPIALIASPAGFGLYSKNDFKVIDQPSEAVSNLFAAHGIVIAGGQAMIWDIQRKWIKEVRIGTLGPAGKPVQVAYTKETMDLTS